MRSFAGPNGGKLLSLMAHILVRTILLIVITLSSFLAAGCSGLFGDPYDQANYYVDEANKAIEEHNRLFEEARGTYEKAKESVESTEASSKGNSRETTVQQAENITQARETMEGARDALDEAREPLSEVQDLDVEEEIIQYSMLLSESVNAQIRAENREIDFYALLEEDPTLSDDRKEAEDRLTEVGDGYKEADDDYNRAQDLAAANPDLLQES
jgi:hypothetical protein